MCCRACARLGQRAVTELLQLLLLLHLLQSAQLFGIGFFEGAAAAAVAATAAAASSSQQGMMSLLLLLLLLHLLLHLLLLETNYLA